ncbi:MAG: sulfotransferase family protein [Pirellulaceae bacterium]
MWLGCNLPGWCRILSKHRFAVEWPYGYIAAIDTAGALFNSTLGGIQAGIYGRAVRRQQVAPPIFIIGHWRSGTTLLHELLALDPELAYPTNYHCFCPNHFLLTEWLFPRLLGFVFPKQRPMDNMELGWSGPQEDEFALCNLGIGSPYWKLAFPNQPVAYPEYYDLEALTPAQFAQWQSAWIGFLQQVSYRRRNRLVLKSPLHSFRIRALRRIFPEALFIHIVRNPFTLFSSTVHMWKSLYSAHGLQKPTFDGLEEHVLETGERMYASIERTRADIPPDRFHELRYEDLVEDPARCLDELYQRLELGDFSRLAPGIENYQRQKAGYQRNRYELSDAQRARVAERWLPYFAKYGYCVHDAADPTLSSAAC